MPEADVQKLVDRLTAQKGIKITYTKIEGANHFFDNHKPKWWTWSRTMSNAGWITPIRDGSKNLAFDHD